MSLGALEPKFWTRFCALVEHPEWVANQLERGEKGAALHREVEALFRTRTLEEWVEIFADQDVCCEPVLTLIQALEHESVSPEGSLRFNITAADGTVFEQICTPVLSPLNADGNIPPPGLGEHTFALLSEAGLSPALVARVTGTESA